MADRYIAFLRGINVGGHRVKMERLRQIFTEIGLTNVRSYINSGNLFFDTNEKDRKISTKMIEQHLYSTLGYEVPDRPPSGTFPADTLPARSTLRFFHTLEKILRAAQE